MADTQDFEDARRGFVGTIDPMRIEAGDGRTVWDMDQYAFLEEERPATANPSLWRQAQLLAIHGLFDFNFHIPANAIYFSLLAGIFFFTPAEDRA